VALFPSPGSWNWLFMHPVWGIMNRMAGKSAAGVISLPACPWDPCLGNCWRANSRAGWRIWGLQRRLSWRRAPTMAGSPMIFSAPCGICAARTCSTGCWSLPRRDSNASRPRWRGLRGRCAGFNHGQPCPHFVRNEAGGWRGLYLPTNCWTHCRCIGCSGTGPVVAGANWGSQRVREGGPGVPSHRARSWRLTVG